MCKMECQRPLTGLILLIIGFGGIGGKGKKGCLDPDNFRCVDYWKWPDYYCNQGWVRRNCGRMCGTCNVTDELKETDTIAIVEVKAMTKPIKSGCDEIDDFRCDLYRDAKEHYCRQRWVMQNCKYLCGGCGVINEVEETLIIAREKRVLMISDNSTDIETRDDAKTEKKLDISNTPETTADGNEDVKVVTNPDDERTRNNVNVDNLNKKESNKNAQKIIKDEANKKSNNKEEEKRKLKNIILAMKGKKKKNPANKEVKSKAMKIYVHLNQKNETKTEMNVKESDKMKKDKTFGDNEIEKGITKEGKHIHDNKAILKQRYSETNVTIKVDAEIHNSGKEEKKIVKKRTEEDNNKESLQREIQRKMKILFHGKVDIQKQKQGESSLYPDLAITGRSGKKADKNNADDNKKNRSSETVQNKTSQEEKGSKMKKMNTRKGTDKAITDEVLMIKDDESAVHQNDNQSEIIKSVKNKIKKENQMTMNDEKDDKKEDKMKTKETDEELYNSYQKKIQGGNMIARENTNQGKTMETKMNKKKETTKNDHYMSTKDKKMAIANNATKIPETGTTMQVVDDATKEKKLIKDANAKITVEVPSVKQRKDDEKKSSKIDRQDDEDGIKKMITKAQDIIESSIREIEEIWITPFNESHEVEQTKMFERDSKEKENRRRVDFEVAKKYKTMGKTIPEEVSSIVKLNRNIVNLQILETEQNKILWDGEAAKPEREPDCKKLDNFRCFYLRKGKSGLCQISWFQRNCKYMCGICNSTTLDGPSYEIKFQIPVV